MAGDTKEEARPTVLHSSETSRWKSTLAVILWLSPIHLTVLLLILVLFVLPYRWSCTLAAVMIALMFAPLYEKSAVATQVANFVCKHGPSHFPITTIIEDIEALDPKRAYRVARRFRNYLQKDPREIDAEYKNMRCSSKEFFYTFVFAVEPHSVIPMGVVALCHQTGNLPLQRIKCLASSAVFRTPILRHIWTWLGLVSASRKVLTDFLKDGCSCALIPGGVREMLFMEHDREVVYLKQRVSFIRVAIETGAPLVPCFVFGQTHVYKWWKPKGRVYNQICRLLRFAPLVFWGMFGSPIPFRRPMHVIVGKPIEVKKNPRPSAEEVSEVQSSFIFALQELYEKYKADAGYTGVPLYVY